MESDLVTSAPASPSPEQVRELYQLIGGYRVSQAIAGITKKMSCHSLRHTFATIKAERNVSPYQLQEWLGHRNLNTTQIYGDC